MSQKKSKTTQQSNTLLLAIIFGCDTQFCTKCGKRVESPILFNEKPHHPKCLPYFPEK